MVQDVVLSSPSSGKGFCYIKDIMLVYECFRD